jgi:hypothetical protein
VSGLSDDAGQVDADHCGGGRGASMRGVAANPFRDQARANGELSLCVTRAGTSGRDRPPAAHPSVLGPSVSFTRTPSQILSATPPRDTIVRLTLVSRGPVGWRLSN